MLLMETSVFFSKRESGLGVQGRILKFMVVLVFSKESEEKA